MRLTPQRIGGAFGYAGLLALFAVAVVVVTVLHFAGLLLLGLLVWLVAVRAELHEDRPSWPIPGGDALPRRPEQAAQADAERHRLNGFIRFYRGCAVALTLLGAAGLAAQWQGWLPW